MRISNRFSRLLHARRGKKPPEPPRLTISRELLHEDDEQSTVTGGLFLVFRNRDSSSDDEPLTFR